MLLSAAHTALIRFGAGCWLEPPRTLRTFVATNLWSYGEDIRVTIGDDGAVTISSRCRHTLQVFDWGKNHANVERLFTLLDEQVQGFA